MISMLNSPMLAFFTNMHTNMFFYPRSIISRFLLTIFFHQLTSLIVFVGEEHQQREAPKFTNCSNVSIRIVRPLTQNLC
jgi:hypothetical protein